MMDSKEGYSIFYQPLYDRVTVYRGDEICRFFQEPLYSNSRGQAKTWADTNLMESGCLPFGQSFELLGIGFFVGAGDANSSWRDHVVDQSMSLIVSNVVMLRLPILSLPVQQVDQISTFSIKGDGSNCLPLSEKIFFDSGETFELDVEFSRGIEQHNVWLLAVLYGRLWRPAR